MSSATENGLIPWYSEACSSTLATTYSSGSSGERKVVTTDLHHTCTSTHTGVYIKSNESIFFRDIAFLAVLNFFPV